MDIFIPFIYEKKEKEKDNFKQLELYIDEPIYTEYEDDFQDENIIILEII